MRHSTTATATATATVIDPVCGMTIDPATAAGSSVYDETTYHFCNPGCQARFDAAPALYVSSAPAPAAACGCSTGHSCC
jgi:P-type Cu+ transporter